MIHLKKAKKLVMILGITFLIVVLEFLVFLNSVNATTIEAANIYMIGDCGTLLRYKGVPVKVSYVQYTKDDFHYPAYCLDKTKPGAETGEYVVSVKDAIQDVGLWRRIINGYPYQTIEELGVANKEEAFTATKQAIYCYIHGNNLADYSPIGEAGVRTLKAMEQIIREAENSTEVKVSSNLTLKEENIEWKQDENEKSYVSKIFSMSANASVQNYQITVQAENVEGIKITNLENKVQNEFQPTEKFKILIPINKMKEKGNFTVIGEAKIKTKPVLYGTAPNSNLQDYALTAATYEDGKGQTKQEYPKNETKIIIYKQEEGTNEVLENVEFSLLNDKKQPIMQNLKTDIEGKICLENLLPGKYYLQEVTAKQGYQKTNELIEIELAWNEEATIHVYNQKEKKPEITIEKLQSTKEIKRLPVTGK